MMISSTNPGFISTPLAVIDEGASLASSSTESRRYLPYHLRNTSPNSPTTGAGGASKRRNKDLLAPCGLGNMESLLEKRTGGSTSSGDDKSLSSLEKRRRLGHLEAANVNCEHHHDLLEKKEASAEAPIAITGSGMGALHQYHHQQQHVRDDSPLDTTITVKPCFTAPSHVLTVNTEGDDVPPLCAENNSTNSPPGSPRQSPSLVGRLLFEDMQKEEPKMVARAAEKLGSIFKHGTPQECAQAVSLGGHSVLVSALKKWHDFEPVVLHCCHAMFRMIGTYTKRCATGTNEADDGEDEDKFDLVEAFLVMGATSVLVGTLRHYPKSSEVQLFGMGALGNLLGAGNTTSSSSDTSRQAAREFVEELQGTSLICKTMTRFAHKPKVQEFGCWIFARLARMRRFHPILKRQALVAVSTAVQNYPRSGTIERQAASFMGCIFRMRQIAANEEEEEEGHC